MKIKFYYQVYDLLPFVIAMVISNSITCISFDEYLIFKCNKLYDGVMELSGSLAKDVYSALKVWAEDDERGKSAVDERTFYIVPNRPPMLTINTFTTA
ncbi:hypothetical protein NCCP2716_01010 [Sporosarcina sp. NCCP-2716]|uniref:hypothetical protein n=1 Tax=Sporosarcina sp. NCCP-2716 TaxID=2943679 RepID=UPI00203CC802|nr:hypothetical protein [Sporosarcina sp. NCCP-2716]GKV67603.1 hypothetical protein NCCP2716_01010 [Sporosarcina sp. NCCP-2716]